MENKKIIDKIDKETAKLEFEKFTDDWEIDVDFSELDKEDKKGYLTQKKNFVNAVRKGRLKYITKENGDEILEYTFSNKSKTHHGEIVEIRIPEGSDYMVMDDYKEDENTKKTYAVFASMTKKPKGYYSNISAIDIKAIQSIVVLFLAG